MWFSGGGTASVLHSDGSENINCVLDGGKELVLINASYSDVIESDDAGWTDDGSYSMVVRAASSTSSTSRARRRGGVAHPSPCMPPFPRWATGAHAWRTCPCPCDI